MAAHRMGEAIEGRRAVGQHDFGHECDDIGIVVREGLDVSFERVLEQREEPPWPRQSMVATAKPRRRRSVMVSKYFSMYSVRPWNRQTVPKPARGGGVPARIADGKAVAGGENAGHRAVRHRVARDPDQLRLRPCCSPQLVIPEKRLRMPGSERPVFESLITSPAFTDENAAIKKVSNPRRVYAQAPLETRPVQKINHACRPVAAAKHSYLAFKAGSKFSLFEGEPS